ncbi:hypothetical protein CRYUN_Cryun07bG0069500 [Craigia yunnanensis]
MKLVHISNLCRIDTLEYFQYYLWTCTLVENTPNIPFKFASKSDKHRILDGSPWSFDKHLLVLKDYDGNLRPTNYVFDSATFWIRVYGLPLKMMNQGMAERIGGKLGILKGVDTSTE